MAKRDTERPSTARSAATLLGVAERAGVSVMTASRALSGKGYVAAKTRAKVLAAASELNYTPNLSAKVMKGGITGIIGVLVSDLDSIIIGEMLGAISNVTRKAGRDLIIYDTITDLGAEKQGALNQLLGSLCDGLLLVLPRLADGQLELIEKMDLPIVLVNYFKTDTSLPVVRADNRYGARDAVNHLLALGHRRIGFMAGSEFTGQSQERQRGYMEALAQAGIAFDDELIAAGRFKQEAAFEEALKLLALPDPPTAIFAANDSMALGVIEAARSLGRQVPQDLSVVGFDDSPVAAQVHPKLTTVRQPLRVIAEAAVRELLRSIASGDAQHRVEFPSTLIVRETTVPLVRERR